VATRRASVGTNIMRDEIGPAEAAFINVSICMTAAKRLVVLIAASLEALL
jgi:hypothetical protein